MSENLYSYFAPVPSFACLCKYLNKISLYRSYTHQNFTRKSSSFFKQIWILNIYTYTLTGKYYSTSLNRSFSTDPHLPEILQFLLNLSTLIGPACLILNFLEPTKSLYTNECFTMHFNPSNPTIW